MDEKPIPTEIHNLFMDEYRFYLQIGGSPGIVSAEINNQDLTLIFESLLNNIYRDADRYIDPNQNSRRSRIPQYGRILETVMKSIAHHISSPTQNSTLLSTDSGAYRTVLPHIIDALALWHLAYTLPFQTAQYSTKKGYNSKKYLFDTGCANFILTRLMPVQFGTGDQAAAMLLENGVMQDCISYVDSINAIQCYRSNNTVPTELDFVITCRDTHLPLEVKSSERVKQQTLNQLLDYLNRFDIQEGYVVYNGIAETKTIRNKTVRFIPPYLVTKLLKKIRIG